jgi:hypothetical protein
LVAISDIRPHLKKHIAGKLKELVEELNADVDKFNSNPDDAMIPEMEYRQKEIMELQKCMQRLEA